MQLSIRASCRFTSPDQLHFTVEYGQENSSVDAIFWIDPSIFFS